MGKTMPIPPIQPIPVQDITGLNVAVVHFLELYAKHSGQGTLGLYANAMAERGWIDHILPLWAPHKTDDAMTPEDAQHWIRHLMTYEVGNVAAWMMKTGHGTSFSETGPRGVLGRWTPLWDRPEPQRITKQE